MSLCEDLIILELGKDKDNDIEAEINELFKDKSNSQNENELVLLEIHLNEGCNWSLCVCRHKTHGLFEITKLERKH